MKPERTVLDYFAAIVTPLGHVTVVELGGCDGASTVEMLDVIGSKPYDYVVLEAAPYNWDTLFCKVGARTRVIKSAISAHSGSVELFLSGGPGYYGSSSIRKPALHLENYPACRFDESVTVPCITLDDLLAQEGIQGVDFIWADIQGAEGDAILGGARGFANTRYFYAEVSDGELYEGQILQDQMVGRLRSTSGCDWSVEHDFGGNVLYVNNTLVGKP